MERRDFIKMTGAAAAVAAATGIAGGMTRQEVLATTGWPAEE